MAKVRQREGEKIGGGFFVFRRGKRTGRIAWRNNPPAFEHPTRAAAEAEAMRLSLKYPGETFAVFQQVIALAFDPGEQEPDRTATEAGFSAYELLALEEQGMALTPAECARIDRQRASR